MFGLALGWVPGVTPVLSFLETHLKEVVANPLTAVTGLGDTLLF